MSGDAPGWYGKLAALGDFAHRRLPTEVVAATDAWLSRSMATSLQRLGEGWLQSYLTAPVLRFAWAPGVADAQWWFGLLMPSCDNVGRYFPLLIAQSRRQPPLDRLALDHLEAWLDHLAEAATRTLDEDATLEGFEDSLHDAPPWPTPGKTALLDRRGDAGAASYRLAPRSTFSHWLHAMAIDSLQQQLAGSSVWWRHSDPAHESTVSIQRGLPPPESFAQLLSESASG